MQLRKGLKPVNAAARGQLAELSTGSAITNGEGLLRDSTATRCRQKCL